MSDISYRDDFGADDFLALANACGHATIRPLRGAPRSTAQSTLAHGMDLVSSAAFES
jgi:hypothetical protein